MFLIFLLLEGVEGGVRGARQGVGFIEIPRGGVVCQERGERGREGVYGEFGNLGGGGSEISTKINGDYIFTNLGSVM